MTGPTKHVESIARPAALLSNVRKRGGSMTSIGFWERPFSCDYTEELQGIIVSVS